MKRIQKLEDYMVRGQRSVDPRNHPMEQFELFSIPAYDRGTPDRVSGSEVGSTKKMVEPGDLLLSRIVPHIRRAWIVPPRNGSRQIASSEWIVFRHADFEPRYLRHHFLSDAFNAKFMQTVAGVGGSLLRARPDGVAQIAVPTPPIAEQKRIADILDKADAIRRKRQAAIDDFECLTASLFNEMFGDKLAKVEWSPFSNYLDELRYGTSNKSGDSGFVTLRIPNIVRGVIDLTELKTVEATAKELDKLRLIDGDILFVRTNGNPDYVGRCAVFDPSQFEQAELNADEIIYASYLIRARLQKDKLCPVFLQSLLQTSAGRRNVRDKCRTSAGQYNINTKGIGSLQVPDIPIDEQIAFEGQVAALTPMHARLVQMHDESQALFQSLVQRAFRGEL